MPYSNCFVSEPGTHPPGRYCGAMMGGAWRCPPASASVRGPGGGAAAAASASCLRTMSAIDGIGAVWAACGMGCCAASARCCAASTSAAVGGASGASCGMPLAYVPGVRFASANAAYSRGSVISAITAP